MANRSDRDPPSLNVVEGREAHRTNEARIGRSHQGQRAESPRTKGRIQNCNLPARHTQIGPCVPGGVHTNDMDVFIGLDVSLASTAICVLDEKGKILTEARVASAPEALVAFLRKLAHRIATVGLEAGPLSHWLYKGMTDAGFEAVLMETGGC